MRQDSGSVITVELTGYTAQMLLNLICWILSLELFVKDNKINQGIRDLGQCLEQKLKEDSEKIS
ncbi:MAG: hypothetical protein HC815_36425 [Richelia sp. RM1_1_1]|nr:hypothetical protein [Richelia sp. RM1_1_1]